MDNAVIIVAGGSGKRMLSDLPKQFLLLGDKPILMHTIESFYQFDNEIEIVVVLPEEHIKYWKELCSSYQFSINHTTVIGGKERFYSVKNGLSSIKSSGIIGVHDGVRPFVDVSLLNECYTSARNKGNAIPCIEIHESIRILKNNDSSSIVDRNKYRLVQTPQCFKADLLIQAYQQAYNPSFTDDSSVVESNGIDIYLVPGSKQNIKITSPTDLIVAEALSEKMKE